MSTCFRPLTVTGALLAALAVPALVPTAASAATVGLTPAAGIAVTSHLTATGTQTTRFASSWRRNQHTAPARRLPRRTPVLHAPTPVGIVAPVAGTSVPVTPVPVTPVPSTSAPAAVAPVSSPAKAGPEFGAQFHGMWSSYTDAQRDQVLSTMAANGVKSVRIDVSWAMLQPTGPGSYDAWGVGFVDSVINRAHAHGLDPIVTLWLTPAWANGGAGEHALPTNPADYARAAQWAAHRWAGKVSGWEVWNEPNSPDFMVGASPTAYAALLKAAYPAFHAGDASANVLFGGPQYVDVDWVAETLAAGATDSFDTMGVHPYMGMADTSPKLADDGTMWNLQHVKVLHDLLVSHGRGSAPLWFTEFGWSVQPTAADAPNWQRGVTATQQATYLQQTVRLVRATMPYVTRMFWYEDLVGIEDGYNGGYGLVRQDGSATPALQAVASA